jgi:hypothetical protein
MDRYTIVILIAVLENELEMNGNRKKKQGLIHAIEILKSRLELIPMNK